MVSLGIRLDVQAYGFVVNGYCKLGKPNESIPLLSEMRMRGISPSVSSFNAVFQILVDCGELDGELLFF